MDTVSMCEIKHAWYLPACPAHSEPSEMLRVVTGGFSPRAFLPWQRSPKHAYFQVTYLAPRSLERPHSLYPSGGILQMPTVMSAAAAKQPEIQQRLATEVDFLLTYWFDVGVPGPWGGHSQEAARTQIFSILWPFLPLWGRRILCIHPEGGREHAGAEEHRGRASRPGWCWLASLPSTSFAWNSVSWPQVTAREAGNCGPVMHRCGDQLASACLTDHDWGVHIGSGSSGEIYHASSGQSGKTLWSRRDFRNC